MTDQPLGKRLAVTFEAAGDPEPTLPILDTLQEAGVHATFFLDGGWAEAHPSLTRRISSAGHELGNHGYVHPDWTTLSDEQIRDDLRRTEKLVHELTGRSVKPWARPPFGAISDRVLKVLRDAGYHAVYRDAVDGGHWPGETNSTSIHHRTMQSAVDGGVVVFHTNRPATADVLPRVLDDLRERGFQLGPLSTLDRVPPPRLERHPHFADLSVNPGYIRPLEAGRWQSLNLLEMGALARRQANEPERVAILDGTVLNLLTGDGTQPVDWAHAEDDRYLLVLANELRADFQDTEGRDLGYLIARTGDLFLCPRGVRYRLRSTSDSSQRWIAALWLAQDSPED